MLHFYIYFFKQMLIKCYFRLSKYEIKSSSDSEDEEIMIVEDRSNKWDCESILSTNSNIYNHPRLIEEPRVYSIFFFNF